MILIKVTYVLNIFRSGAIANILLDIIPYLKQQGFDINILSLQNIDETDFSVQQCKKQDIKLESLNLNRTDIFSTYIRLKNYFKKNSPNIIHSHLGRSDIFSALCKPDNSKLITTFHSVRSNYNFITSLGYLITDNLVDCRTSVSNSVKKSWYDNWALNSDHSVIYNPVNIDKIREVKVNSSIRKEFNITNDEYMIVNIGRLIKSKGQLYLIRVMKKVIEKNEKIKLVIVGKGNLKNKLKNEIKKLNLEKHVFLAGFRNDIPELLKAADLFVFPSLWEGLGIAVLEAMAAKVPIVASNIETINEYISDGEEAFLVDYNDANEMAYKILDLLNNSFLREKFVTKSYKKVNNWFSSEKIAKEYASLYKRV